MVYSLILVQHVHSKSLEKKNEWEISNLQTSMPQNDFFSYPHIGWIVEMSNILSLNYLVINLKLSS